MNAKFGTLILMIVLFACQQEELLDSSDLLRPQTRLQFPLPNATKVPLDTTFYVEFDQPIEPSSIHPLSFVLIRNREIVSANISFDRNQSQLKLDPTEPLLPETQYTLSIPELIESTDGLKVEPDSWNFTTIDQTLSEPVSPADSAEVTNEIILMDTVTVEEEVMMDEVEEVSAALTMTRYRATFDATWSATTHPTDYPSNSHFSGLIGMTHNDQATLFERGSLASLGIKDMAELGSKANLTNEINTMIIGGNAYSLISGGGIGSSPGTVSVEFDIDPEHPLVTITSMLAPSPDWFIAISNVNMIDNGQWIENLTLEVAIYDAGTDSGGSFRSANLVTSPAENIQTITSEPLAVSGFVTSLGNITLERIVE